MKDIHALLRADIARKDWTAILTRPAHEMRYWDRLPYAAGRRLRLGIPSFRTSGPTIHEETTDHV